MELSDTSSSHEDLTTPAATPPLSAAIPVSMLANYLRDIVPLHLTATAKDVDDALQRPVTLESIAKFCSDPQVRILVARRAIEDAAGPRLSFDTDVSVRSALMESLAFIKKLAILELERPIKSQLRVLELDEQSPIEMLHDYIHAAVSPFVTSFVATGSQPTDRNRLAPVKRQLADLELALINLQQDAEIPEVRLAIHPLIENHLAKARLEDRKLCVEDFGTVDDNILNEIQRSVSTWVKEILKVTTLERDASAGSASQEIGFWINMERALEQIQQRLRQEDVEITMALLKHCKRFMATVGFENDTHLKEAIDKVYNYNSMMKDFPLNELLAATEITAIGDSVKNIFTHLNKLRNTKYPVARALLLESALSKALDEQMRKLLSPMPLLRMKYNDFDEQMNECRDVFKVWSEYDRQFQDLLREVTRKRREHHQPIGHNRLQLPHQALVKRLEKLQEFRRQHMELRAVVMKILKKETSNMADTTALEEINEAYERMINIDLLDTSDEGFDAFDTALKAYNARIDRVEAEITANLRDQLATARNANEMFRIFGKFNALFVRPRVRGAIQEYQSQLISRVKEDINALQEAFKVQYHNTQAARMSELRDFPPTAGRIIWYRQIERQLATYMKRVSVVLGGGWESHPEGKRLKEQGDSFQAHINTQKLFDEWVGQAEGRQVQTAGHIFTIDGKRQLRLSLNFDPQTIMLFKETRNLEWLGFRVPFGLKQMATVVANMYPTAVYLNESIRTYTQTCAKVTNVVEPLVAELHRQIHTTISEGVGLHWENHRLDGYVKRISNEVYTFQEKVDEVITITNGLQEAVNDLGTCDLTYQALNDRLAAMQGLVDEMNLKKYANLTAWVRTLDQQVEEKLLQRLQEILRRWLDDFSQSPTDYDSENRRQPNKVQDATTISGLPVLKTKVHEIRITNQFMYLSPPLEAVRANSLQELHQWLGMVCLLPRIQSSRFDIGSMTTDDGLTETNYQNLLLKLQADESLLQSAYMAIERQLAEVKEYVDTWLNYQALWDLDANTVYDRLNDDIPMWHQLLVEIKDARSTFDNMSTFATFGMVVVDYGQVQTKVNIEYDVWHKRLLKHFGIRMNQATTDMYAQISKARAELEIHTVETSTAEAVSFITFVQDLKRKVKTWKTQVDSIKSGQKLLERQRYQFPNDWLYADMLDGEWDAFSDILLRKDNLIQDEIAALQIKILAEARSVEQKVTDLLAQWENEKPIQGNLEPSMVANILTIFEGKFNRASEEYERLARAKEALDLDLSGENKLTPSISEFNGLKAVWAELNKIWTQLTEIKEMPWVSVVVRKIRQLLDGLLEQMKALPNRMRQYAPYDHLINTIKDYLKANALILELKSEALRERHWKDLQKLLKVSWITSEMTLGNIWDADLLKNESIVREIITVAQGEMGLEEFLKQVKETWTTYEVELVNYQNKTRLVRGWDDLFNKLKEQLNQLHAMKLSPYYKVFADDAENWEDKLNRINALFDVWIDVQRRWVYLEGIFTGSADIANLLPVETSRFGSISSEFLALMKKVSKNSLVVDILNIPNAQKSLERLTDLLGKVQKALGDYLEKERSSFPRFYFVGDEDLLEIIGNSKDISKLQKHFRKMFAGIHLVVLSQDETQVLGMVSKEGEEVDFVKPVNIKENPKINTYLLMIEQQMRLSLADLLAKAVNEVHVFTSDGFHGPTYLQWANQYPSQLVSLAAQVAWSHDVEEALNRGGSDLPLVAESIEEILTFLADTVLTPQPPVLRRKLEHLITELVHQRDVIRQLISSNVNSPQSFEWLAYMRFYFNPKNPNVLDQLRICMADASFNYGFEYLGVADKLVQTPLTDRCYLTMTQALMKRLGGSPFGPAGTGKTESVKALGNQLGRFVLVFNCDEAFDFKAMGRIFIGLCQVGAWGCFDEFNRLEERILSAVSQQIQTIQTALRDSTVGSTIEAELMGKTIGVNPDMAIFVTMNPGYAGRSNLPDNLKQLFRSLAMTSPDRQLISQVMLYSQGFRTAEKLASKVVPLFKLCAEQLSAQSHYDFGLRALKSVLVSSGNVKRDKIVTIKAQAEGQSYNLDESAIADQLNEQEILLQSICETMVPKLVADDIPLLFSLLSDVFPGVEHTPAAMTALRREITQVCLEKHYIEGEMWVDKILQLYQIQSIHHGVMMVGPAGSGKSTAWRVLLTALERVEGSQSVAYVLDPKAISKDDLYGTLDATTREWSDGLFTHILRKIVDNVRNESSKRHWIVFDGDVDPEWVENLNSVLDDNKILTLPNGERLSIPPNVRIMFEVQDLKYATPATVSRCGMVWFSSDVLSTNMVFKRYLARLSSIPLDESEDDILPAHQAQGEIVSPVMQVQLDCAAYLQPLMEPNGLMEKTLAESENLDHIMDFTKLRVVGSLLSMLDKGVCNIIYYNSTHPDFPMDADAMEKYFLKFVVYALIWCLAGDSKLTSRRTLGEYIRSITSIPLPASSEYSIIDYEPSVSSGEWSLWKAKVPIVEVETHKVGAPDVVIPTVDTVRHEDLLYTWLADHKPMVLCGPPGSGKTMTLFSALRGLPDMEVVGLNFSSATTPELVLRTFEHYCEYRKTPNGVVLAPTILGKWLVLFCDEINLPDVDNFGTQRVISFLRQMVEHGGFWRASDHTWVHMERIQFVGACNPPTDPGRKPLSPRFLRHVPVVLVDYPGQESLMQIYGTFNRALLRLFPTLRSHADGLTEAMVGFYSMSQERFTVDMQPHYIYSPRELTRWVRGVYEAIKPLEALSVEMLIRIWAHEALRLFQDRLVLPEEREWTEETINTVADKFFQQADLQVALQRPILFSNWLSKDYVSVELPVLRDFVKARLRVFYEEELDVPLVLFNAVLDHVLRIDRVFRQPQGHMLLIGVSGSGKTTLSRFVAWMNGLKVFQIKVHNKYTMVDFDDDLRYVLRLSGCKGEKICFIMDESNILDAGFLERMNTLLANGEVPGLFEGDEYSTLMTQCKEGSQREGLMLDSNDELYKWFCNQVMQNLHVVFTMNPTTTGLKDRASTSPALFNRCVLDWFGDWSNDALYQVALEFTNKLDLDGTDYNAPPDFPTVLPELPIPPTHRQAVINAFVYVHQTLHSATDKLARRQGRHLHITPRHFLDFINHYVKLFNEKRSDLEDQQLHLNIGLQKIDETVAQVEELQKTLSVKRVELERANIAANDKLKQMVHDQQEAERRRVSSLAIQEELLIKESEVAQRKALVEADLKDVAPAVEEAAKSVRGIKKQQLTEVRALANPPKMVKMAMECVCVLLGETNVDWKSIRGVIIKDDFIANIVNFDTDSITNALRQRITKEYTSNPDFNYESVNRASKACGPLVKWVIAQVMYSDMLLRIEPLRNELRGLEASATETRREVDGTNNLINELEASITRYKEEYASLISTAQSIRTEMATVESKVSRSVGLLDSLSAEQDRWRAESTAFQTQMGTIVGDVLLSAAFLAYGGYFDQQLRGNLTTQWVVHLQKANIECRPDLSLAEYLSTADERLQWQVNGLPVDDLCTENAIMLSRYNRYPLIIDPSGQATRFLVEQFKERKLTKTSFLDDAFRKNLESALRFGNPLLVQDVENYDPILNPVLNRELRRTGGRVLIRLGDQDIDFSPSFNIFLTTRDPTVNFSPDTCSRVTFVNFTITPSSLQSQCLNQVLTAERPDVDQKRSDLLKLQGEFRLKLRHLEKALLDALNGAKGKILDDDNVITTLETLKQEAASINQKVREVDTVMLEVEQVSSIYRGLANHCSAIYFSLEQLSQVHHLYQFSLQLFLDIFHHVLHNNEHLTNLTEPLSRLDVLVYDLFVVTFERVSKSLLHEDRLGFGLLLGYLRVKGTVDEIPEQAFTYFLSGSGGLTHIERFTDDSIISAQAQTQLAHLASSLPVFQDLLSHFTGQSDDWTRYMASNTPEMEVPPCWSTDDTPSAVCTAFYELLVVQATRPDRTLAQIEAVISAIFDSHMLHNDELNLDSVVSKEIKANTPVLMCSVPGYDASTYVENIAGGHNLQTIAIGSAEGYALADKAIASAARSGDWVLLKNVHLSPSWLMSLEKTKLHALNPQPGFRLFMSMEISPKVGGNLLRMSRIFVFSPPPGIKASLLQTLHSIPQSRMDRAPAERSRLYFLLAWFHAIVQERLRYVPLGWSKGYEFNDSDLRCAMDTLDTWVDKAANGRANLAPDAIPWEAIRALLAHSIYGGRVDNDFDQRLLGAFLEALFTPHSFDLDFNLVAPSATRTDGIIIPDARNRAGFLKWIDTLSDTQSPHWLGLPSTADLTLHATQATELTSKLLRMQAIIDDAVSAYAESEKTRRKSLADAKTIGEGEANKQPQWMVQLQATTTQYLKALPETLPQLTRTAENIKDPLFRCLEREVITGMKLLKIVRVDMQHIVEVCQGQKKQTNYLRTILGELSKGMIPKAWNQYNIASTVTLPAWVADFGDRVKQLGHIVANGGRLDSQSLWLGGLFVPEAYITATRQAIAQANGWSLEELSLKVELEMKGSQPGPQGFVITGMRLEGASVGPDGTLHLTKEPFTSLNKTQLTWARSELGTNQTAVTLPVYLNSTRKDLLFTVDIPAPSDAPAHILYQRGVALALSSLL